MQSNQKKPGNIQTPRSSERPSAKQQSILGRYQISIHRGVIATTKDGKACVPRTSTMGKKGKKAQAGKPKKLTPKDVSKRLDALVKKLEQELKGADLFAPLPPTDDCPICFVPLSRLLSKTLYKECCGTVVCIGCDRERDELLGSSDNKVLHANCPFCREPDPTTIEELVRRTKARALKNDPQALYIVGMYYDKGSDGLPVDKLKALHYWTRAAELGNPRAMTNIGVRYNHGEELPVDREKATFFFRAAALNGNIEGRHNLGITEYYDLGNHRVGIRHFKIAAEAGSQLSLNHLKRIYNGYGGSPRKDFIRKDTLDSLFRACHDAQEQVKSEGREKHKEGEEDVYMFKC